MRSDEKQSVKIETQNKMTQYVSNHSAIGVQILQGQFSQIKFCFEKICDTPNLFEKYDFRKHSGVARMYIPSF